MNQKKHGLNCGSMKTGSISLNGYILQTVVLIRMEYAVKLENLEKAKRGGLISIGN